jgi:hypothetical protein
MGSNRKFVGKGCALPCHIKDHKQRGQWVELLFMARAAQYGLGVAKPLGDWEYYDAAVQHRGRFLSVQVKSVMYREHRSYQVNVIAGRNHRLYPTNPPRLLCHLSHPPRSLVHHSLFRDRACPRMHHPGPRHERT